MHRENNERVGLLSYIKGNRKGREAHDLEREAMQDSFLADALDGYDNAGDPEVADRLHRMEEKVTQYNPLAANIAAASARTQAPIPVRPEYAMCEMRDDTARPVEPALERLPSANRRRNFVFWISAAAVLVFVCTVSYELGVWSGGEKSGRAAREELFETVAESSAESVSDDVQPADALQSRKEALNRPMGSDAPHYADTGVSPQPASGYKAYYEYIYDQIGQSLNRGANTIDGIVVLSFLIDEEGRPVDCEIVDSTSSQMAEKIIRIIESGERWTTPGRIPAFVVVY